MLLRLVYLAIVNVFSALSLLPMDERDKTAEILALRHQITVLQRQLGDRKVRFSPVDRTFLSALLSPLPRVSALMKFRCDTMSRCASGYTE